MNISLADLYPLGALMLVITTLMTVVVAGSTLMRPTLRHLGLFALVFSCVAVSVLFVVAALIGAFMVMRLLTNNVEIQEWGALFLAGVLLLGLVVYDQRSFRNRRVSVTGADQESA